MRDSNSDLVVICKVQGEPVANVIKSHLESEGIPAHIRSESLGTLYGLNAVGLGRISIMVPREFYEEAKHIIEPEIIDHNQNENEDKSKNLGIVVITSAILIALLLILIF